jgi:methylated-DNA-[protein]-cysteine S-methyltransferase
MHIETIPLPQARKTLKDVPLSYGYADTPIGFVTLRFAGKYIIALDYGQRAAKGEQDSTRAQTAVDAYFQTSSPNASLLLIGTEFQTTIWKTLAATQAGETLSYGELARIAGYPRAARAVGKAMNKNPIALFIPCHRVIASDGTLGGFACDIDIKRKLLQMEQR